MARFEGGFMTTELFIEVTGMEEFWIAVTALLGFLTALAKRWV